MDIEENDEKHEKAQHDRGHHHEVTIVVDGTNRLVRAGKWIVSDLKEFLNIGQARVLAEITPHGLKDLQDDSQIEVHEGEKFMTHARRGSSS